MSTLEILTFLMVTLNTGCQAVLFIKIERDRRRQRQEEDYLTSCLASACEQSPDGKMTIRLEQEGRRP